MPALKNKGGVDPAEGEVVGHHMFELHRASIAGNPMS
jgi:predicted aconitase with swiveling domain